MFYEYKYKKEILGKNVSVSLQKVNAGDGEGGGAPRAVCWWMGWDGEAASPSWRTSYSLVGCVHQ